MLHFSILLSCVLIAYITGIYFGKKQKYPTRKEVFLEHQNHALRADIEDKINLIQKLSRELWNKEERIEDLTEQIHEVSIIRLEKNVKLLHDNLEKNTELLKGLNKN